jgi:flagellar M-ring protein FliF
VPKAPTALPEVPVWEKGWVQNLIKQGVGALGVLFIVLFVLKPVLKSLAEKGSQESVATMTPEMLAQMAGNNSQALPGAAGAEGALENQMGAAGQQQYEDQVTKAKSMATQDPARVAQVVKNWVGNDA